MNKTKIAFFVFTLVSSFTIHAEEKFLKEVSYYMAFGGLGPKMREERVFKIDETGKKPVANKILVDETNEVREFYTQNKDDKTPAEKYFQLAGETQDSSPVEGKYVKDVSYYMAFGGVGPKMREEKVFKLTNEGKTLIAEKILVDETNELRELYNRDKSDKTPPENYFKLAEASMPKQKDKSLKGTCEEITETYVICNGNRYVLDSRPVDSLKRLMKDVQEWKPSDKSNSNTQK